MDNAPITYHVARIVVSILFCATFLRAQTNEYVIFQAVMLPENLAPPITNLNLSGTGNVEVSLVRNSAGQVVSGTLLFYTQGSLTGSATFTAIHIHRGAAGVNGPVTASVPPTLVGTREFELTTQQTDVQENDQAGREMLEGLLQDPTQFYLDVHTAEFPDGAMRGQLRRANQLQITLQALVSPTNVVPAITALNASGVAQLWINAVQEDSGAIVSAHINMRLSYSFPEQVTFTGFHVHPGIAGASGPVTLAANPGCSFATEIQSTSTGSGGLGGGCVTRVLNDATARQTLAGLLTNPGNYYIDLHTTANPDGALRGQLRRTEETVFPMTMLPTNVVPPVTGLAASAVGLLQINTLRAEAGSVEAAWVFPIVNFRFPGAIQGGGIVMHIHAGAAGVNGPIALGLGTGPVASIIATGFGLAGLFPFPTTDANVLATVNSLLQNPQNYFMDVHTAPNPGGAVRAQLATALTAPPAVNSGGVLSAVLDKSATTLAPLGLFTIFGTSLANRTTALGGGGNTLPESVSGVTVDIGGKRARLLYVAPTQINGQLPVDTPTGLQQLIVNNGNATSAPVSVTVAPSAPAIFFNSAGGAVLKNADYSRVEPGNPARAGDVLLIYFTGAGQTNPPLSSGAIASFPPLLVTAPVRVTIGGQMAEVLYSAASPGFAGLYQAAVKMPSAVPPGNAPVVLSIGESNSNTVTIAVR